MKKTLAIVIPIFVCLVYTTGFCFVYHSPPILETRNWKLETVSLSADPIGLQGGSNLYAYGEGNPMAYIDPLGLCAEQSVWGAFWEGFMEGLQGGGSIIANTLTFGYSDSWGWTSSYEYQGFEYDVSRVLSQGSRDLLLTTAGTATLGTAIKAANTALMPQTLYHFTSQAGAAGIASTGGIQATMNGVHGIGTYLTSFNNATMATIQGARSTAVAIPVATQGLSITPTWFPGTYIIKGASLLLP